VRCALHEAIRTGSGIIGISHVRLPGAAGRDEDVCSGFHGHIPRTAIIPRVAQRAVINGSVLTGGRGLQYCPAPRIPLTRLVDIPGRVPGNAPASVLEKHGSDAGHAIVVAFVFMVSFLFTVVNTQYGKHKFIEPGVASGFAATFNALIISQSREFCLNHGIYQARRINNCEVGGNCCRTRRQARYEPGSSPG